MTEAREGKGIGTSCKILQGPARLWKRLQKNLPDSSIDVSLQNTSNIGYDIKVGYEIIQLKQYNGNVCQNDINYKVTQIHTMAKLKNDPNSKMTQINK